MSEVKLSYTKDQIIERMFWDILAELKCKADESGVKEEVEGFKVDWGVNGDSLTACAVYRNREKREKSKKGIVYILKSSGCYKIGVSKNLKSRMNSLQTANPNKIELVYSKSIYDYEKHEKILHQSFLENRVSGEWFELTSGQVESAISYIEDQS